MMFTRHCQLNVLYICVHDCVLWQGGNENFLNHIADNIANTHVDWLRVAPWPWRNVFVKQMRDKACTEMRIGLFCTGGVWRRCLYWECRYVVLAIQWRVTGDKMCWWFYYCVLAAFRVFVLFYVCTATKVLFFVTNVSTATNASLTKKMLLTGTQCSY